MNNNIRNMYIGLGMTVLILGALACGSVQVGIVTPTPEGDPQSVEGDKVPVSDPPSLEAVQTQAENEPTSAPTAEPETPTPEPAARIPTMAYLGPDGNLWVLESGRDMPRQLTFDANRMGGEGDAVQYESPKLSSDGGLLAYRQDVGTPIDGGYDVTPGLWVMDLGTGEVRQVLEGYSYGYAWKPGTHLLAYGPGVDMDYFMTRGQPDADLATGIRALDLDDGQTLSLVLPERGLALS
ncbi:hypothetical protein ACFLXI_09320, partial [Chloroflexota bacterium]